jgi:hypothetical protein
MYLYIFLKSSALMMPVLNSLRRNPDFLECKVSLTGAIKGLQLVHSCCLLPAWRSWPLIDLREKLIDLIRGFIAKAFGTFRNAL